MLFRSGARVVAESLVHRLGRYEPRGLDFGQGAAVASSAPEAVAVVEPLAPEALAEPPASAELTPEQLRAARLAYFSKQQQQPQIQVSSEQFKRQLWVGLEMKWLN